VQFHQVCEDAVGGGRRQRWVQPTIDPGHHLLGRSQAIAQRSDDFLLPPRAMLQILVD
jgi:hypothetical protein